MQIGGGGGGKGRRPETRQRMLRETEAWLNWAVKQPGGLPRIPTRRVGASGEGGYGDLVRRPLGRLLATHWWARAIQKLGD